MISTSWLLICQSTGSGAREEHISSCKVEIHFEEAAYLLVRAPSSVSMATQPPHHLLLSLPTPPFLVITNLCHIPSQIPFPGDLPPASLFPLCSYFKI